MDYSRSEWTLPLLSIAVLLLVVFAIDPTQRTADFFLRESKSTSVGSPSVDSSTSQAEKSVNFKLLSSPNTTLGKDGKVYVEVDSLTEKLSAATVEILFDREVISIKEVMAGSFFENSTILSKKIDNNKGLVNISVGSIEARSGTGELLVIILQPNKTGKTEISFSEQTKAAAVGRGSQDVRSKLEGITLTVTN